MEIIKKKELKKTDCRKQCGVVEKKIQGHWKNLIAKMIIVIDIGNLARVLKDQKRIIGNDECE